MAKYKTLILSGIGIIALLIGFNVVSAYNNYTVPTKPAEIVYNSSYDGSVKQVEDWLESNFNDPDSIQKIEWSEVQKTEQGKYIVRYKFRAKNSLGGREIYNKAFILAANGQVITMIDYPS